MKSKNTFTAIFFTRKSRKNPHKLYIYTRITINGKRAEISLKRSIHHLGWNPDRGKAKGNTHKASSINAYLDQVYSRLLECHKELLEEDNQSKKRNSILINRVLKNWKKIAEYAFKKKT